MTETVFDPMVIDAKYWATYLFVFSFALIAITRITYSWL